MGRHRETRDPSAQWRPKLLGLSRWMPDHVKPDPLSGANLVAGVLLGCLV